MASVQHEIKQPRAFASLSQEAVVALLRTASLVRRRFEALMQAHDITFQQFNVLRILRGAGEPLPTMEVAARMIEPEPGITRLMERLVRRGLVHRARSDEDGRRLLCSITPEGRRVLAALDAPVADLDEHVLGPLTPGRLRTLIDLLDQAREPMIEDPVSSQ